MPGVRHIHIPKRTPRSTRIRIALWSACALSCLPAPAQSPPEAPPAGPDLRELAKATQNPVADLVSIPFQFNFNTGGGLQDQTYLNLNIQPVFPISLTKKWKLIARTIIPVDNFPGPSQTRFSGVGNIQSELFFTPAKPGKMIIGIGPTFSLPTSTASPSTTGTWAAGGGLVLLKATRHWVVGSLFRPILAAH